MRRINQHRISIKTILLLNSLLFLLLPLGSIYFLRIYESALIRQTESELISQAAFVGAIYKNQLQTVLKERGVPLAGYGISVSEQANPYSPLQVIPPRLDLTKDDIRSERPLAMQTQDRLDEAAYTTGLAIQPVLQDAQQVTLSGIKVLDYQGIVAAGREERELSFAHAEEFLQAKQGMPVSLLRKRRMPKNTVPLDSISRGARINVFVALPIVHSQRLLGVVWVNRTPTSLAEALYGKREELLWATLILLGATLILTAMTSYTIIRPIRSLVEQIRFVERGDKASFEPIPHPITRELAELSESFATLSRKMQERGEYIRNFANHVSHEFKTPLTAIQGSVELLREDFLSMSAEQRERFLANISADTERMKRLVSRLLELARADLSEAGDQQADLLTTLQGVVSRFNTPQFNVTIENRTSVDLLQVAISQESLEAVMTNLLENSRQVGANLVSLIVSIHEAESVISSRRVVIQVVDNGTGVSEGNRSQIFTPFFTTHRQHGGTGLGLSITQSLLQRYGGNIKLVPREQGACFEITLLVPQKPAG